MNRILFRVLRFTGLTILFRELIQKNKVTILLFHDINLKTAEKTFAYLLKKYNIIDLNVLIDAIENENKDKIPPKALILTFDDGHIGNYDLLPAIKKYNIPVTVFLCASIINTTRHFWFKYKNSSIATSDLKYMSNKERLNILLKNGFKQDKDFKKPQALQKKHIQEMKPFVNMQSHTLFHPILPKCSSSEAKSEIFDSKTMLEKDYGLKINAISYPNGDYSDRDILLSKKAGYKCGITVDYGFNTINTDAFRLKRISVNDTEDINELIVKASGVWAFLKTLNGHKQNYGYIKKC